MNSQTTIRKIANGYIVSTMGGPMTGMSETFYATLGEVYLALGQQFEPQTDPLAGLDVGDAS